MCVCGCMYHFTYHSARDFSMGLAYEFIPITHELCMQMQVKKENAVNVCACLLDLTNTQKTHTHNTHADLALGPHQKDNDTTADPISLAMLDCNIGCCFLVFHTARLRYSTTRLRYSTARLKHY